jgi:hypothetical protein
MGHDDRVAQLRQRFDHDLGVVARTKVRLVVREIDGVRPAQASFEGVCESIPSCGRLARTVAPSAVMSVRASRVVLVPNLAGAPAILLAEHRDTYLIAYPAPSMPGIEAGLRTIGHALNDASRVAILAHLRHGEATSPSSPTRLGLRSPPHITTSSNSAPPDSSPSAGTRKDAATPSTRTASRQQSEHSTNSRAQKTFLDRPTHAR